MTIPRSLSNPQHCESPPMFEPKFNPEKFRNLILYLAHRCKDDRHFGATKLNKMLYYCDFTAFAKLGKPITGAEYQKLEQGPAPRQLVKQRQILIDAGRATLQLESVFPYTIQRLSPTAGTNELGEAFAPDELEVINEVVSEMHDLTARETSEMSHQEAGWILANNGETIPYETAWLASPTDPEIMDIIHALHEEKPSQHAQPTPA